VSVDKLSADSLSGGVVWRKCKKKDGEKELERGFKGSNVRGKPQRRKAKYHFLFYEVHVLLVEYVHCKRGCIQFFFSAM
jgi:hypothetical protein